MTEEPTIYLMVKFHVKSECVDEARALFSKHEQDGKGDPGNLEFRVFHDVEEETRFSSFEAWESEEAIEAHDATEHHADFLENLARIQLREKEVQTLRAGL